MFYLINNDKPFFFFVMSIYDSLSENKLPATQEELLAEIHQIDALTGQSRDSDPDYTLDGRFALMQRRVFLGNMRQLFRRTIKEKKVEVRPFEVTQGISAELMGPVSRVIAELDQIDKKDATVVNNNSNTRKLIMQVFQNLFPETISEE